MRINDHRLARGCQGMLSHDFAGRGLNDEQLARVLDEADRGADLAFTERERRTSSGHMALTHAHSSPSSSNE
jgi:hypothetical protein